MSSKKHDNISDYKSESIAVPRGRPRSDPARILAATDALFARSADPLNVTMDDIAAASDIGKGTLFRAFGSREGLLDALWAQKLAALKVVVAACMQPLAVTDSGVSAVAAFIDAVLVFKFENAHILRARELAPQILQTPHYRWMHDALSQLVVRTGREDADAGFLAHALLATLHIDLLQQRLAEGLSVQAIRQKQARLVAALIGSP